MVREGYKYDGLYDWVKRKRAEAAVKDGPVAGLKDATKGRSDTHGSRPSDRTRGGDRARNHGVGRAENAARADNSMLNSTARQIVNSRTDSPRYVCCENDLCW